MTPTDTPTTMPTDTPTDTPSPALGTYTASPTATPGDEFSVSDNVYQPGEGRDFIIHYRVQNPGKYSLMIYNSAGELVRILQQLQSRWPVEDDVPWNGRNMKGDKVASGVYIVYFESSHYIRTAKILVLH